MLEDIERMNLLLDQYRPLLTEKQAEAMELHYTSDLSFKEIAEEYGISKAAAYDLIHRTELLLEHYESKLHLVKNSQERLAAYEKMIRSDDPKLREWGEILHKLEEREE